MKGAEGSRHIGNSRMKAGIFYFSATGNTRQVAFWIKEDLEKKGWIVETFNIELFQKNILKMPDLRSYSLVFVGYPVFAWREPFNVRDFIKRNFAEKELNVVQFFTYGGILGNAPFKLWLVLSKGNRYFGKIHIRAEDSHPVLRRKWTMIFIKKGWNLCKDRALLSERLARVLRRFEKGKIAYEVPHPLAFILDVIGIAYSKGMIDLWFKKWIDFEKCTSCALCWRYCPAGVIEPMEKEKGGQVKLIPRFLKGCIGCYRCVNICPFDALRSFFTKGGIKYKPYGIFSDYTEAGFSPPGK